MAKSLQILVILLLSLLLGTSLAGCGKGDDDRIEMADIKKALAESTFRIEYEDEVTPPKGLGITEVLGGTAYDNNGNSVRFMWSLWRDPSAIDKHAQWKPELGGDVEAPCSYGNARVFISRTPASSDSARADSENETDGVAQSRIFYGVGCDILEEISPYERHGV